MLSRRSGKPIVVIAVPVLAGTTVRGGLFNVIELSSYSQRLVAPIRVLDTGYAFLFDLNGQVLAHPDAAKIMKFKLQDAEWGQRILAAHDGQISYSFGGSRARRQAEGDFDFPQWDAVVAEVTFNGDE